LWRKYVPVSTKAALELSDREELKPAALPMAPTWAARLDAFVSEVRERSDHVIGFPESQALLQDPLLAELHQLALNNLGEPYEVNGPIRYATNSLEFEREVLAWFADLYQLPVSDSWGYVTGSGSEGNTWGLWLGREACGGTAASPVLYRAEAAHYSVDKAAFLLGIEQRVIGNQPTGEMDYQALGTAISELRHRPAIVLATAGTTITEAIDDPDQIRRVLNNAGVTRSYIHVDAALCGLTLPFYPDPTAVELISFRRPIDSLSVSIHKAIGAPSPCGIGMARRHHVLEVRKKVEYVASGTGTMFGSRSGFAPVYILHAIHTLGPQLSRLVAQCARNAQYFTDALRRHGIPAWRNPYALTVVFPAPSEPLVRRWSLPTQGGQAHVVTVPSVTRPKLDEFLAEYLSEGQANHRRGQGLPPSPAPAVLEG
jgi:histidine decarboxylase